MASPLSVTSADEAHSLLRPPVGGAPTRDGPAEATVTETAPSRAAGA